MANKKRIAGNGHRATGKAAGALLAQSGFFQHSILTKFERIPTSIYRDSREASRLVAHEIADLIRQKRKQGQPCVLGLATGSTPLAVYGELIRMHQQEGLCFNQVVSFNLDE